MIVYPTRKVKVLPPKNIKRNDVQMFKEFSFYNSAQLKIEHYKDVTLVPSGIGLKNSKIIQESIHPNKDYYNSFLQSVKDQLETGTLKTLENQKTYLLVHNQWCGGYYHWIIEALSRLWICKDMLSEVVFLLPLYPAKIRTTHLESLRPFKFVEIFPVVQGVNMYIPNLIIPSNYIANGIFVPEIICQLRSMYHDYLQLNGLCNTTSSEKIYITRKNAGRRKIVNEDEIINLMKSYGYDIISTEKLSFFEVVAIMSKAKYLVSIYGAGLTNMMFMKAGSKVFELQKKLTSTGEAFDAVFLNLASVCGLDYYYQFCEPVDENEPKITADIEVDIKEFRKSIEDFMFNTKRRLIIDAVS